MHFHQIFQQVKAAPAAWLILLIDPPAPEGTDTGLPTASASRPKARLATAQGLVSARKCSLCAKGHPIGEEECKPTPCDGSEPCRLCKALYMNAEEMCVYGQEPTAVPVIRRSTDAQQSTYSKRPVPGTVVPLSLYISHRYVPVTAYLNARGWASFESENLVVCWGFSKSVRSDFEAAGGSFSCSRVRVICHLRGTAMPPWETFRQNRDTVH